MARRLAGAILAMVAAAGTIASAASALPRERGVDVLWYADGTPRAQLDQRARETFSYVKGLSANAVAIYFPFFVSGPHSDRVFAKANTPSAAALERMISLARSYGLRVSVRPLLDERNLFPSGHWRGSIRPANVRAWLESYAAFLRPYLRAAQTARAADFYLSVELSSIEGNAAWHVVVDEARSLFHGTLAVANNWDQFALGYRGAAGLVAKQTVDAYPRFRLADSATVPELTAAWESWFEQARSKHAGVVLSEVGIPAQPGVYRHSNSWGNPRKPIRPAIQRKWFEAALRTAQQLGFGGVYFWSLNLSQAFDPGVPRPPSSFRGRGDSVIKAYFRAWSRGHMK